MPRDTNYERCIVESMEYCITIQYCGKIWNEVMLLLIQMMGCNAYIPLLTRQMNDTEDKSIPYNFFCP